METMENSDMNNILEMAFHLYATSEDIPECPLDQDGFLGQAMETATDFARRWKAGGLPEYRMLDSFYNTDIRACILMDIHKHIPFDDQVLDRLDEAWQLQQRFSPQRKLLRDIDDNHQQSKQTQWGEE